MPSEAVGVAVGVAVESGANRVSFYFSVIIEGCFVFSGGLRSSTTGWLLDGRLDMSINHGAGGVLDSSGRLDSPLTAAGVAAWSFWRDILLLTGEVFDDLLQALIPFWRVVLCCARERLAPRTRQQATSGRKGRIGSSPRLVAIEASHRAVDTVWYDVLLPSSRTSCPWRVFHGGDGGVWQQKW